MTSFSYSSFPLFVFFFVFGEGSQATRYWIFEPAAAGLCSTKNPHSRHLQSFFFFFTPQRSWDFVINYTAFSFGVCVPSGQPASHLLPFPRFGTFNLSHIVVVLVLNDFQETLEEIEEDRSRTEDERMLGTFSWLPLNTRVMCVQHQAEAVLSSILFLPLIWQLQSAK